MMRGWIRYGVAVAAGAVLLYGGQVLAVQVAGVSLPFVAAAPVAPLYEWTVFRFGFGSSMDPLNALLRQGWEVSVTETVRDPGDGVKMVVLRRRIA